MMKRILCALMIMLLPVMAYADYLGIKKADEYVVMQVEALNAAGLRAKPDSVHVLTYLDQNDLALAYSARNTTYPFATTTFIDTSKIFGDTTYWFSDQIQDIDGAPSPSSQYTLTIDIVMWTAAIPTHNIATVQVISDSLQNYLDSLLDIRTETAGLNGLTPLQAADNIGINWGDVTNQSTAVDLSATITNLVNTATAITNDVTLTDAEHGLISDSVWLHDTTAFTAGGTFGFAATHGAATSISDADMGLIADSVWKKDTSDVDATASGIGNFLMDTIAAIIDTLQNQDNWVAREASLFDPTSDAVANVTLTATTTDVTNLTATAVDDIWDADTSTADAAAGFGRAVAEGARATLPANKLDITAAGEAGIDLDNTSGTLDAAQFGADFITAAKIADDAVDEISEKVWFNIDTLNVDSSKIGEWLVNNLAVAGALSAADIVAIADTVWNRDTTDANDATSMGLVLGKGYRDVLEVKDTSNAIIDSIQNLATLTDIQTIGSRTVVKRGIVKTAPNVIGFSSTAFTEADDYWIDNVIEMRTGTAIGQITRISDFTASTDSATFSPAFSVEPAVGDSFYILANFEESPSAGSVTAADIVAIADTIFSRDSSDINAGAATSFGTLMAKEQYVTGFDPVNDAVANVTLTATTTAVTTDVTLTDAEHGLISDSVWLHDTVGFTSVADFGHAVTHPNLDNATGTLSDAQIDNITVGALDATAVDDIMDADTNTADLASGFGRAIAEGARATLPANKLDISATGEAGVDWNNVGTPGATVALSATTVNLVTTTTTATNLTTNNDKTGYTLTAVEWENVWFDIDTVNVDSSKIGEWLVNNLPVAGALSAADIVAIADTIFKRDSSDVNAGAATSFGTLMMKPAYVQGSASGLSAAEVADSVWSANLELHDGTAGSFGDSAQGWGATSAGGTDTLNIKNNDGEKFYFSLRR